MNKINCFITYDSGAGWGEGLKELAAHPQVNRVTLMAKEEPGELAEGCTFLQTEGALSTESIRQIADASRDAYHVMLITSPNKIRFGMLAIERFLEVSRGTGAPMVYSDFFDLNDGKQTAHPLVDYQEGSLRDDFDFGPLLFYRSESLIRAAAEIKKDLAFAGLYQLRLALSREQMPLRIPEFLYAVEPVDNRVSGKKMFDYVDPKNRQVQIEMEEAVTVHLKEIGGYLEPEFKAIAFESGKFPVEASVIIPVLNREKTVADAIESVMKQECDFEFNLILINNHSSDRTTEIVNELAAKYSNLLHVIPERRDLGIGGCWNFGVHRPECGKFAVQLDSDDLYAEKDVLSRIVAAFYEQQCAMVVGSYRMTNFKLEEIPPGIIDHKEWTPQNGRNNALRINGLGAPRAFYTPVLREINIPNVSYGEDYGVGLAISRQYQIGRIYDPLYLCRRWEDNSDASLSIEAQNKHNTYKDRLRSIELKSRIYLNTQD